MSGEGQKYWFPAKRFGWGWGFPTVWQGWVVLITYLALVVGGVPVVQGTIGNLVYVLYLVVLTIAFIAICWVKGEPRWRGRDA
jgi:hypothetical protein